MSERYWGREASRGKREPTRMGTPMGHPIAKAFLWEIFLPFFNRTYIPRNYSNSFLPIICSCLYILFYLFCISSMSEKESISFHKRALLLPLLPQMKGKGACSPIYPPFRRPWFFLQHLKPKLVSLVLFPPYTFQVEFISSISNCFHITMR